MLSHMYSDAHTSHYINFEQCLSVGVMQLSAQESLGVESVMSLTVKWIMNA